MAQITPYEGGGIPLALPASSGTVSGSQEGEYLGISVAETGGSSNLTVTVYDSSSGASGTILDVVYVPKGQAVEPTFYPRPGKRVVNGIVVVYTGGGTPSGSVFQ